MATKFDPDGSIKRDSAVRHPAAQGRIDLGVIVSVAAIAVLVGVGILLTMQDAVTLSG